MPSREPVHRAQTPPAQLSAELSLPPVASSVVAFRHFAATTLLSWQLDAIRDTAELLVSELVTNAVTYAATPVSLRIARLDGRVQVVVVDGDVHQPVRRVPASDDEHGRGLMLVDMLAASWGTRVAAPTGKAVWFELPTLPAASP